MSPRTVSDVLAVVAAEVVAEDHDVTGALAALIAGAAEVLPADAAAVLVRSPSQLDVLAATSHRAADLEVTRSRSTRARASTPCATARRWTSWVRRPSAPFAPRRPGRARVRLRDRPRDPAPVEGRRSVLSTSSAPRPTASGRPARPRAARSPTR